MSDDPRASGAERIGRRGLAVLVVAGAVGIGLAIHGYGRGQLTAGSGGLTALGSKTSSAGHTATHASTSPRTTAQAAAPSQKSGPLLSSTSYAQYAFRVYPGPETSQTRQEIAGFKIEVTPRAGALQLSIGTVGSGQPPQTSMIRPGDRVYFVEATLGDDSNDQDYNFGDDGVVVTDATGHIVQ
jgi:hypothetical protein